MAGHDSIPWQDCTLERFEIEFAGRHRVHDAITHWARRRPDAPAIINATRGTTLTWAALDSLSANVASGLLRLGLRRGDFLAASLPFSTEHIVLEYACFRSGVIHVPLDLRLPPAEVVRAVGAVQAKAYAFGGDVPVIDDLCPRVRHLISSTVLAAMLASRADTPPVEEPREEDGAQVIFTTGSTGLPKPALLSHRGITCQNMCLGTGFDFSEGMRILVNLPPSHVGGQAELLLTSLFHGGTAVVLETFDAAKSLEAIQKYQVKLIGQIPAMFHLEWRLSNYNSHGLSSVGAAIYGGQQVSRAFLEKLASMAPRIGTGLGLTESSGFCTYTRPDAPVAEIEASIGHSMPAYPLTIRAAMRGDGRAGDELAAGETGHICFNGPQTFLGYVNDPQATARAISSDGFLYTGDMGFYDSHGLHFSGRAKWVIKPAGNQVFPGEVENFIAALGEKVAGVAVVGVEHKLWSEGIIAFVETRAGAELTVEELKKHARGLASYKRPLHYVLLEQGQLPLNRTAKVDTLRLQQMAREEVERLRARGRWDGSPAFLTGSRGEAREEAVDTRRAPLSARRRT